MGGGNKFLCTGAEFGLNGNADSTLEGVVMLGGFSPGPSRHPVEITWQRPAEVAAVDRPGSTDAGAADDVSHAHRVIGKGGGKTAGHRAARSDRQDGDIGGEIPYRSIVESGTGFKQRHVTVRIC